MILTLEVLLLLLQAHRQVKLSVLARVFLQVLGQPKLSVLPDCRGSQPLSSSGLAKWLKHSPEVVDLKDAPLQIQQVSLAQATTTYAKLAAVEPGRSLSLTFVSPTSFRRQGHHLPLPWSRNVFHGLGAKANDNPEYVQLFYTLGHYAPYCGTGHKTTFGLGQTRLGWHLSQATPQEMPAAQRLLADRIDELTTYFVNQKKRTGGHRAQDSAETWATVLARRELGDSLQAIADDLEIPYETAKTYSKLARRSLREKG
ncbi:hypothetical protein IQ254_23730 [Nodosilinea sp. LEGE 07088]|uniref:hypothetical protein n=1 Tax=Nodosilinea sp. LEGE 07088 TaxID=2777968 RepID=UPI00187E8111|nr:hypothetical protein [Nodosilinea sp. LEGE 07088]MBE9140171.1 hypothetical protein [Nodosilinea sp. LEGE 07088]